MIASVGSWIVGSGTVSTRTSWVPCQVKALIGASRYPRSTGRERSCRTPVRTPLRRRCARRDPGSARRMRIGLFLSSEEFGPHELVDLAVRAERAGFSGLWISDHYHPWNDEQGHSPFVWSTIGAIAHATDLPLGTGVTCPTLRIHPAIVAQAAATSAVLLNGRFTLGVGSGEALNEHVLGDRWPEADVRLEMLEEAIEVLRLLWEGGQRSHHGRHYAVQNARIYTLPRESPAILVSGFGPKAVDLAARVGDG